ncbi:MAG: hypothetical protein K2G77_03610, partial [Muribaculaceae bacterium]|nr:hypothetical protein [Muribaculaceae bacterium]
MEVPISERDKAVGLPLSEAVYGISRKGAKDSSHAKKLSRRGAKGSLRSSVFSLQSLVFSLQKSALGSKGRGGSLASLRIAGLRETRRIISQISIYP